MPSKPSNDVLQAKDIDLTTIDILTVTINEMNNPSLERELVESGLAEYVTESEDN